jgi:glycyl-tRNA synthetase beta chain
MDDFLLEIGAEEIPASFLKPAALALAGELDRWFQENRIAAGRPESFYTPRRLAVRFRKVADAQESKTVVLQGPPRKAAFDADGNPTKTGLGFARSHGKEVSDLTVKATPKGDYVFLTKTIPALATTGLLTAALPEIIARLPFPKNMRWGSMGFRFARPIRWLLALFGTEVHGRDARATSRVLKFQIEDVVADDFTFGLRLALPARVRVSTPGEYESVLAGLGVTVDPSRRREAILTAGRELLSGTEGELVSDEELLDETVNVVESPRPILCRFASEYLALPPIVVVTALKKHQRCFAIQDRSGKLLPLFIAVTNTPNCDTTAVKSWYERAAESRLRDAQFFIEEDRKIGLEALSQLEHEVTWIEGLGSLQDKTRRLQELGRELAGMAPEADVGVLVRAAYLAKADLLSNMVREKEYTSLQGVVGGIYASLQGEPEAVARAISEHYAPRSLDDPLPVTAEGRLLSIADKLDNIGAAFALGSLPTGSEDPFALRRQATGILRIVLEADWPLDLRALLARSLELLGCQDQERFTQLSDFFRERLRLLLGDRGVHYDVANAVLEVSWANPTDARRRAEALAEFRLKPEFERLAIGQKRVSNILKGLLPGATVDEQLLKEPSEQALYQAARRLDSDLTQALAARDYHRAMELSLSLRAPIDQFFDDVMVMCEEPMLARNRQALVSYVRSLFLRVADLSLMVVARSEK